MAENENITSQSAGADVNGVQENTAPQTEAAASEQQSDAGLPQTKNENQQVSEDEMRKNEVADESQGGTTQQQSDDSSRNNGEIAVKPQDNTPQRQNDDKMSEGGENSNDPQREAKPQGDNNSSQDTENISADDVQSEQTEQSENVGKAKKSKDKSKKKSKSVEETQDNADVKPLNPEEIAEIEKTVSSSIISSKRVKHEELRRKFKQAMIIMLVFALVVTSVVYVMLLFMQENNVRITANSKMKDKALSLSLDNSMWAPYINANGPNTIWDVSYNPVYGRERIDTVEEVRRMLSADNVEVGAMNGTNFIRFVFMLKNTGKYDAYVEYEMTLEHDKRGLQNAVRVMWGESFKDSVAEPEVTVYAALSNSPRLANTVINSGRAPDMGYIEYCAYPMETNNPNYDITEYERKIEGDLFSEAYAAGYFRTTPFENEEYVFQRKQTVKQGDIMYCYVCIWFEGSDFDCVNDALGGYVKLGINFVAY